MALLFQRLAHNFVKNGYFPTDGNTLGRILSALLPGAGKLRIWDPCCGEGTALAEVAQHLSGTGAEVTSLGIEFDGERAWHAKQLLTRVVHSDMHDVEITPRSVGLLFLNPPYGDAISDKAQLGDHTRNERLEKIFYRRTIGAMQFGAVLVLIVPVYVIDEEFAIMISRNFDHVKFFMSPETRFRQCVIFGIKKRAEHPVKQVTEMLQQGGRGELAKKVLPEQWQDEPYAVPAACAADCHMVAVRIDEPQLQAELERLSRHTLWPQFGAMFAKGGKPAKAPLRDMSSWHLALALAAGQICGVVRAVNGRTLLIKGDTFKEKSKTVEYQPDADGNLTQIRTMTDKFVPVIRGIEFTPGDNLGSIVTIR